MAKVANAEHYRYASYAQPHAWMITADDLFMQAVALRERKDPGIRSWQDVNGEYLEWRLDDRAVFLLGGFALENAIKAFLVYENPQWISNGSLCGDLKSHKLLNLRDLSSLIPYKGRYNRVIADFEAGLETWTRYPCGLSSDKTMDLPNVNFDLWRDYIRVMRAYGRKMVSLLSEDWYGPHGLHAKYAIKGVPFFGVQKRLAMRWGV